MGVRAVSFLLLSKNCTSRQNKDVVMAENLYYIKVGRLDFLLVISVYGAAAPFFVLGFMLLGRWYFERKRFQ